MQEPKYWTKTPIVHLTLVFLALLYFILFSIEKIDTPFQQQTEYILLFAGIFVVLPSLGIVLLLFVIYTIRYYITLSKFKKLDGTNKKVN